MTKSTQDEDAQDVILEETGVIVPFEPEPTVAAVLVAPAVSPTHGGEIIETLWDGHPNFTCSRCGYARLNRAAVEDHINTPVDH
jgi:hypothetical protein